MFLQGFGFEMSFLSLFLLRVRLVCEGVGGFCVSALWDSPDSVVTAGGSLGRGFYRGRWITELPSKPTRGVRFLLVLLRVDPAFLERATC